MATYVLIHGAYQGGWIWKLVSRRLAALGHEVHAPTLDGCAERGRPDDDPRQQETGHGSQPDDARQGHRDNGCREQDDDVCQVGQAHGWFYR